MGTLLLELFQKTVAAKVISKGLAWAGDFWLRRKAKHALVNASVRPRINLSELVPKHLTGLANGGLPIEFDNTGVRDWLRDSNTQRALLAFYEAHQSGEQANLEVLNALETRFEECTGETRNKAFIYISGIRDYLDTTFFGAASRTEAIQIALLRQILSRIAEQDSLDPSSLRQRVMRPCSAIIRRAKTRWHYPGATVATRMEMIRPNSATNSSAEIVGIREIQRLILNGGNVLIEGEAGSGKTTALLDLASLLLSDGASPIPIFVDAATWAASEQSLLEYVAQLPSFLSEGLTLAQLARLHESGQLMLVLNGWNEISIKRWSDVRQLLQSFLMGSAQPRIIVATRTASDALGIPALNRVRMLGFGWEQQKQLIQNVLPKQEAEVLIQRLRTDLRLRSVTRNPLVLSGVVSLQATGHVIPDNAFDLIDAVVTAYERDVERAAALKQQPLRNCQRAYSKAMASAMNSAASTLLSAADANRVAHGVSRELVSEAYLQTAPEPPDVVGELCNQYLLHQTEAETIRFAHQRFQEYFGASALLERLDKAKQVHQRTEIQSSVLNWSFWTDSTDLVAAKVRSDPTRNTERRLLVELAMPVDLAYASDLAGAVRLNPSDGPVWQHLQSTLETIFRHPSAEARHYALECMAATRSSVFAHHLWTLLESDDQQVRLGAYRLSDGLTVEQLGTEAEAHFARWSDVRRAEAVSELAHNTENLSYVTRLAQSDGPTLVRVAAMNSLDFYGADDTTLETWRSAPKDVKEATEALRVPLEIWSPDNVELTQELLQIARTTSNPDVRRRIGLHLLSHAEDIGKATAKEALQASADRRDTEDLAKFVKTFDPGFVKQLALKRISERPSNDEWIRREVLELSPHEREALFESALADMSKSDHERLDLRAFSSLASAAQIERLLDEGERYVVTWITTHQMDDETRRRYRATDRALRNVPGDLLIAAIIHRTDQSTYYEAGWHCELLDGLTSDPRDGTDDGAHWRPDRANADTLVQLLQHKRDPRPVPHCHLEAHLASFASKVNANRYLSFILECAKRQMAAWFVFEQAVKEWLASGHRTERPQNPPYGQYVNHALQRCGLDALEGLLALASEPGADAVVPESLVNIVADPWRQNTPKHFPFQESFVEEHQRRRELGKILQEPSQLAQAAADRVARLLLEKLAPAVTAGAPIEPDRNGSQPNFFPLSKTAALLARVPSALAMPALTRVLERPDLRGYTYQGIAQGLIRQGALLPASVLHGLKETIVRESTPTWLDESTRYLLTGLAILHLFVDPIEQGVRQLNELFPDILKKADLWQFARELQLVPNEQALDVLLSLQTTPQHQESLSENILLWLRKNIEHVRPQRLVQLVEDGTLFKLGRQQYLFEREIAPRLANVISRVPVLIEPLLNALQTRTDPADEPSVCAILSNLADPRGRLLLRRFLDETATARGGETASRLLLDRFVSQEHADPAGGWYHIYPQAWNEFREWLFDMASNAGPSQNRSRALLLRLEENRRETGRPADEPRHPRIESKLSWPTGLYL